MKEVTKEVYLKWYEDMLLWRKFEDKLAAYTYTKKVRGFHLYNGQEVLQGIACNGFDKM
jgi:pyruvate dehydrogenase E1 component alpha subunit